MESKTKFIPGKVYYHKADGRRLVYISPIGEQYSFRHLDLKTYRYELGEFWDFEVQDMPVQESYKRWSVE